MTKTGIVIIKEKRLSTDGDGGIAIVRSNCYGSSIEWLNKLFEEAKKDFPHLEPMNAEVKYYGGSSYKRTYGIEFGYDGECPDGYSQIQELENVM